MTKKRLEYIDMVRGIGTLGIIIMHAGVVPQPVTSWTSSFALPVFFLVSGFLIGPTGETEKRGRDILLKKGRSLLAPFLSFSLLYLVKEAVNVALGVSGVENLYLQGIYLVTLWGTSVLWFLPVLLGGEMLFLFLHKKLGIVWTCIVSIIMTMVSYYAKGILQAQEAFFLSKLWWNALYCVIYSVLRPFCALPYLCAGYVLFRMGKGFWGRETGCSVWQFLGGVLLFFAGIPLSVINGYFDFRLLNIGTVPVLGYLSAALSFAGILLVCKNSIPIKPLAYFGRNSLIVMATHMDFYFLYVALTVAYKIDQYIPRLNRVFFFVNVIGMVLLLEIPCIEVINRFFPFLMGRKKLRQ